MKQLDITMVMFDRFVSV